MNEQLELFTDMKVKRTLKKQNYGEFTDKFKVKLTTDDCYTPEPIYNAVKDWTVKHYSLEGREIVRPFWPGGDFECFKYPENCVVIDNPPFSIYDRILKFYTENGIDFLLFGPSLTLFKKYDCCYIVTNETITYANGAKVNTSFATNLDKDYRILCDIELKDAIRSAEKSISNKKEDLPIIEYPVNIVSAAILGKTCRVDFKVRKEEAAWCPKVNGERIFGGGFILSDRAAADRAAADRAAADRAAADRAAADRAAARRKIVRHLGESEKALLEQLNAHA